MQYTVPEKMLCRSLTHGTAKRLSASAREMVCLTANLAPSTTEPCRRAGSEIAAAACPRAAVASAALASGAGRGADTTVRRNTGFVSSSAAGSRDALGRAARRAAQPPCPGLSISGGQGRLQSSFHMAAAASIHGTSGMCSQNVLGPKMHGPNGMDFQSSLGPELNGPRGMDFQSALGQKKRGPIGMDFQSSLGPEMRGPGGTCFQHVLGLKMHGPNGMDFQSSLGLEMRGPSGTGERPRLAASRRPGPRGQQCGRNGRNAERYAKRHGRATISALGAEVAASGARRASAALGMRNVLSGSGCTSRESEGRPASWNEDCDSEKAPETPEFPLEEGGARANVTARWSRVVGQSSRRSDAGLGVGGRRHCPPDR